MFRLLMLRAVPLLLRPAAVIFEGAVTAGGNMIVLVLPIAMLALTISSIPVYREYFKSLPTQSNRGELAQIYMSALTWLTIASLSILLPTLVLLPLGLDSALIGAVCIVFLIEKLADEASRALEFRKSFGKWFFVQTLRSGWFFLAVAASLAGFEYETAFLVTGVLVCSVMYIVFIKVLGLTPCLRLDGLPSIRDNLVFLLGGFLPASYRQLPRIVIAKIYPEQAHVFLAMAQLCQAIGLVFNVYFQIPYRKIIARRTIIFQKLLQPAMLLILMLSGLIAIAYIVLPVALPVRELSNIELALLLGPILTADALTFAVLSTYLGYLPWVANKLLALITYFLCLASALVFLTVVFIVGAVDYIMLLSVPALTMGVAYIWMIIISKLVFANGSQWLNRIDCKIKKLMQ